MPGAILDSTLESFDRERIRLLRRAAQFLELLVVRFSHGGSQCDPTPIVDLGYLICRDPAGGS